MCPQADRKVLVVYKRAHPPAELLAQEIGKWLVENGYSATLRESGAYQKDDIEGSFSFAIVLGGDGTIIGTARKLIGKKVPLLGINFGGIGFLATLQPDGWKENLLSSLNKKGQISRHLALSWTIFRNSRPRATGHAVNDLVVGRGELARLLNIRLCINDHALGNVRSDGIIISTPIGSTGYSLSAGGPLLDPELKALIAVPICPFCKSMYPMVLPADSALSLTIGSESPESFLTVDGQEGHALQAGDAVHVQAIIDGVWLLGMGGGFGQRLISRGFLFDNDFYTRNRIAGSK